MTTPDTAALVAALEARADEAGYPKSGLLREAASAIEAAQAEITRLRAENGTLVTETAKLAQRMGGEMQLLRDELKAARAEALEEAAQVAERFGAEPAPANDDCGTRVLRDVDGHQIAAAIRALIPAPLTGKQEGR